MVCYASVTSNHGPRTIFSTHTISCPYIRPSEAPVGVLRRCCSHGHIRLRARTAWHGWTVMVWSNNSQVSTWTPCDARTGAVQIPHENVFPTENAFPTGPVRDPCGTRRGAVRHPYGHARELTQTKFAKIPHGRRIWPYGARTVPARAVYDLNPYGVHKLTMHALKLYGPIRGGKIRTAPHGAHAGPVSWRTIFVQNSPGTREQSVRGPGVWCDWGTKPYGPHIRGGKIHTAPHGVRIWAPWVDVRFLFKIAREQPVRGPGVWCDWGINGHSVCQQDWDNVFFHKKK